ncbi:hypothetical protein EA797_10870 [Stutzerimonas zhaodongensis]|uniref:Uncharacterized protein n=1 Tax=Stutzerimonas zhaodongensis TaxID=1176257 RepID=A0A3M2HQZ5_9GAMM|nr:hypothetical protein EA797_10870 [Stutzerimonas zhaodongensis]
MSSGYLCQKGLIRWLARPEYSGASSIGINRAGHGALGLFLTLKDGRRFFFRGDAAEAEPSPIQLPVDVMQIHKAPVQEGLGFYPTWNR